MKTVIRQVFFISLCVAMSIVTGNAQSPAPMVVQAASAVSSQAKPAPVSESNALSDALKSLQEMRAANQDTLKKQQDALERLDGLQKAAQQLKIFTHRTGG
jgi:hypothetical protein